MSKIRAKNTGVEKKIFKLLRINKIYFQKHYKNVIGNPDICLPSKKKAVFIDGDFWHGYQFLRLKNRLPKKYWQAKIERNINRDKKVRSTLKKKGWQVLRVWEHEIIKNTDKTMNKIISFLS